MKDRIITFSVLIRWCLTIFFVVMARIMPNFCWYMLLICSFFMELYWYLWVKSMREMNLFIEGAKQ